MNKGAKTNISLSKINLELFNENIKKNNLDIKNDLKGLIQFIEKKFKDENIPYELDSASNNVTYIVFLKINKIKWKSFINEVTNNKLENKNDLFSNRSPSYILIKKIDNELYCLTAGYADNLINEVKDKLFGLTILTKIFKNVDAVIKRKSETRIDGKRNAITFGNRFITSFEEERTYNSFATKLDVIANEEIQESLGLLINRKPKETVKDIQIKFGSNIEIGKELQLNEINSLIEHIHKLYIDKDNIKFAINPISSADKFGFKTSEINIAFYEHLLTNPNVFIVNQSDFFIHEMDLYTRNDKKITEEIIDCHTIDDLTKYINDAIIASGKPERILDYYLLNKDESINTSTKYKIYNLIDYSFEYLGRVLYLIDGNWYSFDEDYNSFYEKEYKTILNESCIFAEKEFSYENLDLNIKKYRNETLFNETIKSHPNIMHTDQKYYDRVEIADAIYYDNAKNKLILFHNKNIFDGSSVRDVTGQIRTSANLITSIRRNPLNQFDKIDKYINGIYNKDKSKITKKELTEHLFQLNTEIIYIAAFVKEIDENTNSNYIKHLLTGTKGELFENSIRFYVY